jgi:hypothetical protein
LTESRGKSIGFHEKEDPALFYGAGSFGFSFHQGVKVALIGGR